jgi:hypothetical protein
MFRFSHVHPKSRSVPRGRQSQRGPRLSAGSAVQANSLSSTNGRNVEVELQFRNWECQDAPLTSLHSCRRSSRSIVPSCNAWVWSKRTEYSRKMKEGSLKSNRLKKLTGMPVQVSMYGRRVSEQLPLFQETPFHLFQLPNLGVCYISTFIEKVHVFWLRSLLLCSLRKTWTLSARFLFSATVLEEGPASIVSFSERAWDPAPVIQAPYGTSQFCLWSLCWSLR